MFSSAPGKISKENSFSNILKLPKLLRGSISNSIQHPRKKKRFWRAISIQNCRVGGKVPLALRNFPVAPVPKFNSHKD